jgi:hypothetical protein
MKRENLEIIGGFLMIIALPWLAFIECVFGTQDKDWHGRKRGIASGGVIGCIAWISFLVQLALFIAVGLLIGSVL